MASDILSQPMHRGASYEATFRYRLPFGVGFQSAIDSLKEHLWDACKQNDCTFLLLDADEDAKTVRFRWRFDGSAEKAAPIVVGIMIGLAIAFAFMLLTVVGVVKLEGNVAGGLGVGFLVGALLVVFLLFRYGKPR